MLTSRLCGLVCALVTLAACSTSDREIQTPSGGRQGEGTGPLIVLGVVSKATSTKSVPNAQNAFEEIFTVNVPPGTEIIVPALSGWTLGYGSTTPEDLSPQTAPGSKFQ